MGHSVSKVKIYRNAFFMPNSFLFFNIIPFDTNTLRPTLFQFLYPLKEVESFITFKIHIHNGDNLFIRRKSFFPEPNLEVLK